MKQEFDNKFGLMDGKKVVIEGVGTDAEVVANADGGLQSKSPAALHLIDPHFLAEQSACYLSTPEGSAIGFLTTYMFSNIKQSLYLAVDALEKDRIKQLLTIGRILQYGVTHGNNGKGYPANNWRLIPREEHINHALIHLVAALAGDTQDDHVDHAMCRLMMAIATEETKGFSYTEYVPKAS